MTSKGDEQELAEKLWRAADFLLGVGMSPETDSFGAEWHSRLHDARSAVLEAVQHLAKPSKRK